MMYVEKDDFRQIYVISKNEMRKFIRGKRFLIYVILAAAMFSLITFLPYALGGSLENMNKYLTNNFQFVSFLVVLAATLFISSTYVSEFEERTALILFTRPVKKTTIYIGKFIGCFIMEAVVLIGYYAAMAAGYLFLSDTPSAGQYLASLGCLLIFLFAATAFSAVFSVTMKRSGTAAIMTFVTILFLLSIVSGVIIISTGTTPWYMLDQASNAVYATIPGVAANLGLVDFDLALGIAVMIVWGAVATVLSWFLFTRKEM